MTERIKMLREQSLNAVPTVSSERGVLLTEFYQSGAADGLSVPVQRAKAFYYIMDKKELCFHDGELIVGERGPSAKATPTYPEVCIHSEQDLDMLDSREKVFFKVGDKDRKDHLEKVYPHWHGKSHREKVMLHMTEEWKNAYAAGVFTEFQEQRAPGHTVLGEKVFRTGLNGLKEEIADAIAALDFYNDPEAFDKKEELTAMDIAADAVINYAERHADALRGLAELETDEKRKLELQEMSAICSRVPANAPETFWEALQFYWFLHVGVITETNPWDSFNPGRLDQHLYPFYSNDMDTGAITEESAKELLGSFWIKFNNHPAPPKVGVTAKESNTYTDFALINVGGLKADGSNAVNDFSYVLLDVIEEMRLLQPSSMVQISKKTPDRFLKRALNIIKTGFGQPSIFNSDAIVQELVRQGKDIVDARNGGASGCVESGAFGTESYILSGYFNLTKILELTLYGGYDKRTEKQVGLNIEPDFNTFEELMAAYEKQLNYFIDIKIRGNNVIERLYAEHIPVPFLSILVEDCISKGKDYNDGGARYNTTYIQGVGLGSITDSLTSLRYNVYDKERVSLKQMREILDADFDGYDDERIMFLEDTPKYGNDDDYADELSVQVFEMFYEAVNERPNTKGGHHRINMLPTTSHVYFGSVIGATPDGRKAKIPLSEGISPVQGSDRNGPTSVIKSASKIDHIRTGGTLLNQRFSVDFMHTYEGIDKVANLVRSYFKLDGHHIQFNVMNVDKLREAQKKPENYRDLIVRVAGYSDYFVDITEELQEEIIKRTEHEGV
ncbi:trans-4-hydroxy-L-proline dehydratase [Limisalsivibrio acetivorans]|uniref:trans-4-hydroxy-L-proline dehydratase n=1 Tax=Limisalsivibrio acetivorans TaxID=1304888 RepID=UPI0003B6AAFC|nr:trans-4-hydroxy-L-proline dehydratase [Limisalsivibrio acetivorans]